MKFELSLKSTHQDIIHELKNKLSLESDQDIVKKAVESALQMKSNDLIFATEREKCVGGCFGATPCFEMELEENDYQELKSVFEKYDFEDYDSEAEAISKTIRCILNFIDQEPESITLQWFHQPFKYFQILFF